MFKRVVVALFTLGSVQGSSIVHGFEVSPSLPVLTMDFANYQQAVTRDASVRDYAAPYGDLIYYDKAELFLLERDAKKVPGLCMQNEKGGDIGFVLSTLFFNKQITQCRGSGLKFGKSFDRDLNLVYCFIDAKDSREVAQNEPFLLKENYSCFAAKCLEIVDVQVPETVFPFQGEVLKDVPGVCFVSEYQAKMRVCTPQRAMLALAYYVGDSTVWDGKQQKERDKQNLLSLLPGIRDRFAAWENNRE